MAKQILVLPYVATVLHDKEEGDTDTVCQPGGTSLAGDWWALCFSEKSQSTY